jgi:hypothetical protein
MKNLFNKVPELMASLEARRLNETKFVNFRTHFEQALKGETFDELVHELGISGNVVLGDAWRSEGLSAERKHARRAVLQEIFLNKVHQGMVGLSTNVQNRSTFITPEHILAPVMVGSIQGAFWDKLISIRENSINGGLTATVPYVPLQGAKMKPRAEDSKPERRKLKIGSKTVNFQAQHLALEVSDDYQYHTINLVMYFFEQLGQEIGAGKNADIISTFINGDQPSGDDAAIIGIGNPAAEFTYRDVSRVFTRMSLINKTPDVIVLSEKMATHWLDLPEVKKREYGTALISLNGSWVPSSMTPVVSPTMPSTKFGLVDTSQAFGEVVGRPLRLESERDIEEKFTLTVADEKQGFWSWNRQARVIVDTTVAIDPVKEAANTPATDGTWFPDFFNQGV